MSKTIDELSPQEAYDELMRMKSDPKWKAAYLSKYGEHGHLHDEAVERVTALFHQILPVENDKFDPILDQEYDAQGRPDDAATQRVYEAHVRHEQSRDLAEKLGIKAPSKDKAKDGILGKLTDKDGKDEALRTVEQLKGDAGFMSSYRSSYPDRKAHDEAVAEMTAAYAREAEGDTAQ